MTERRFNRVAVLEGGPSAEREVSLRSGAAVANGLRAAGYDVREVDVTGFEIDLPEDVEAVFIALHGEFGEDGQVQRMLEMKGIPYTGSGSAASRLAFDKKGSKEVFMREGVCTPEFRVLCSDVAIDSVPDLPDLPVVVKPVRQGSSIGVNMVFREDQWEAALADARKYDRKVVIEKYIEGRELTVGIVGEDVLSAIEIVTPNDWYHYDSKYSSGVTEYLVPAPLDELCARECRDLSCRAFEVLGCRGFGRVDLRMSADGHVYVLEVNSIPGFTETSLLPKAAKEAGMDFPELCDRIMDLARIVGKW